MDSSAIMPKKTGIAIIRTFCRCSFGVVYLCKCFQIRNSALKVVRPSAAVVMYVIKLLKVMPIESGALCSFGLGRAKDREFGVSCEGLIIHNSRDEEVDGKLKISVMNENTELQHSPKPLMEKFNSESSVSYTWRDEECNGQTLS